MSYAALSSGAVREALEAFSSPRGLRLLEGVERLGRELDEALGPAPLRVRIRTPYGPVVLEFGEPTEVEP